VGAAVSSAGVSPALVEHLALGAAGEDARRTAAEKAALLISAVLS
jgi:hypothetical protein